MASKGAKNATRYNQDSDESPSKPGVAQELRRMPVEEDLASTFVNEKPIRVVMAIDALEDPFIRQISQEVDSTYSHTVKLLQRLSDSDIVVSEQKGRKKIFNLTETGKQLAKEFNDLERIFDGFSDEDRGRNSRPKLSDQTL